MITLQKLLEKGIKALEKENIPHAQLEAEVLLYSVLQKPKEYLITHYRLLPSRNQIKQFNQKIKSKIAGQPTAYLTNNKEFFGLLFFVNKNVLVPRPETETLVELALNELKKTPNEKKQKVLVDVGTGCGNIAISLLKNAPQKIKKVYAIDISTPALKVAQKNARLHGIESKIVFLKGNLLEPLPQSTQIDILLANLPYVPNNFFGEAPFYEPSIAILGGRDGLFLYRQFLKQIKNRLIKAKNNPQVVLMEISPFQIKKMKQIIKNCWGEDIQVEIFKDLGGVKRVIKLSHFS